ncbi:MAG: hypothetical protein NPMRD2_660003 [Nitrosopumilales archaeon]|nr:MAG: hypothetical protein NPMRD2_660003 [Nitrosopumilales archaeon]
MSKELSKRAIDLLLNGATLVGEPCPYCKGVRVMKNGYALCINCGKEPEITKTEPEFTKVQNTESTLSILEKKLQNLSKELEAEKDHVKQQQILKSINSLVEILAKLKN